MADINVDLGDIRGLRGYTGVRGSQWYTGTAITHTTGSATPATGIDDALAGDMYLNTETSDVYQCTTGGGSGEAVWTFAVNIKGANGNGSLVAEEAGDGYTEVTFTDAEGNVTTFRAGNTRPTSTATITGGRTDASGTTAAAKIAYRRGDIVAVALDISGFSSGYTWNGDANNVMGFVPSGFRPQILQYVAGRAVIGGSWHEVLYSIHTDGSIRAEQRPSGLTGKNTSRVVVRGTYMRD